MTFEITLDLPESFPTFSASTDALRQTYPKYLTPESSFSNPRSSQRRLRTETPNQYSQAFIKTKFAKETGFGILEKNQVSILTTAANASKNDKDTKMLASAKKANKASIGGNWLGFVVGGALMLVGAAVLPFNPPAGGIIASTGFGIMMNEAIETGKKTISGIDF